MEQYSGSCHCGEVRFSFKTKIESLLDCNCSICHKLGSLWIFLPSEEVAFEKGLDSLKKYQFGEKRLTHQFCQNCGVEVLASGSDGEGNNLFGINVRSLDDFDWSDLEIRKHDGKSM